MKAWHQLTALVDFLYLIQQGCQQLWYSSKRASKIIDSVIIMTNISFQIQSSRNRQVTGNCSRSPRDGRIKHMCKPCVPGAPSQHQLQSYRIAGKFDWELNLWLGWKCLIKSANIIFTLHMQWRNACSWPHLAPLYTSCTCSLLSTGTLPVIFLANLHTHSFVQVPQVEGEQSSMMKAHTMLMIT